MTTRPYLLKMPCIDCGRTMVWITTRKLRCKPCSEKKIHDPKIMSKIRKELNYPRRGDALKEASNDD